VTVSVSVDNVLDKKYSEWFYEQAQGINMWGEASLRF
jgi:outer membrane receptor protein involved in Fe transport